MPESSFEARIRTLAYQADLKVSGTTGRSAKLLFTFDVNGLLTRQTVWIIPYDETWEFSCLSFIKERNPEAIPKVLLIYALQENSTNKRGFWTLNHYENSGNHVLEYMDNIAGALLTPAEFSNICWAVAKAVDGLERMLRRMGLL